MSDNHDQLPASAKKTLFLKFLIAKKSSGFLTQAEVTDITRMDLEHLEQQGYSDGDAFAQIVLYGRKPPEGIAAQGLHLMRTRLKELHPELIDELESFLSDRRHGGPGRTV